MELEKDNEPQTVSYYGKKTYLIAPSLARTKNTPIKEKPQYSFEDVEEGKDR